MASNFGHIELITRDLDKAKDFYHKLLGWKARDLPDIPYSLFNETLSPTGGMMKNPQNSTESFWIPYIVTDDINRLTEKARSLATIHREVMVGANTDGSASSTTPLAPRSGFGNRKWSRLRHGRNRRRNARR